MIRIKSFSFHKKLSRYLKKNVNDPLTEIFKEVTVPEPLDFHITRWGKEKYSQMSYSFVKLGSSGADYDEMAEPASDRLFFAGEATNRLVNPFSNSVFRFLGTTRKQ